MGVYRRAQEDLGCNRYVHSGRSHESHTDIRYQGRSLLGFLAKSSLILALVLTLIPRCAFAASPVLSYNDMGILWGPQLIDAPNELNGVVVSANSNLNAALVSLGHDVLDPNLTHDVKAKLSNESTGGAFYAFAQLFESAYPVGGPQNFPSWGYTPGSSTTSMWGAFATWVTSLGEGNVWWAEYTDAQFASAGEDLEAVLNGGNAGGSGGGSGGGDSSGGGGGSGLPDDVPLYYTGNGTDYFGSVVAAEYDAAFKTAFDDWVGTANWFVGTGASSSTLTDVMIYRIGEKDSTADVTLEYENGVLKRLRNNSLTTINVYKRYIYPQSFDSSSKVLTMKGLQRNYNYDSVSPGRFFNLTDRVYCSKLNGGGGGSDVLPDNNWPDPDEPVTPEPPDPNPPSGGGNTTSPTIPKPTNPTQPINVTVTTVTPVDDILDALNKIIQELENHCVHLQNKMVECSKYIGEVLLQVRDSIIDAFDTNADFNARLHDDLMGYLEDLFGWLRDNMNFDLTVTNSGKDDDIIDLLRLIFIQDGTGDINLRPVDITQDYDGFGFWTHLLVGETLPDLTDTNLSPVTSAFDNLDDKFPFSVPSDILRILQSLDKPAQTPVLTFTMPAVGGIPSYSYVVDLSPYDSAMQTVRTIELVGFVVFLLVWARRSLMTEVAGADD